MTDHRPASAANGLTWRRFPETGNGVIALTVPGRPDTARGTGGHGAGCPPIPSMPPFHGLGRRAWTMIDAAAVYAIAAYCLDPNRGICDVRAIPPAK